MHIEYQCGIWACHLWKQTPVRIYSPVKPPGCVSNQTQIFLAFNCSFSCGKTHLPVVKKKDFTEIIPKFSWSLQHQLALEIQGFNSTSVNESKTCELIAPLWSLGLFQRLQETFEENIVGVLSGSKCRIFFKCPRAPSVTLHAPWTIASLAFAWRNAWVNWSSERVEAQETGGPVKAPGCHCVG